MPVRDSNNQIGCGCNIYQQSPTCQRSVGTYLSWGWYLNVDLRYVAAKNSSGRIHPWQNFFGYL
jgi:hypothetical protein